MNARSVRQPRRAWLALLAGLLVAFALALPALAQGGAITLVRNDRGGVIAAQCHQRIDPRSAAGGDPAGR